jgi:hypothetical protein
MFIPSQLSQQPFTNNPEGILWKLYVARNNKTNLDLHVKCLGIFISDFNQIWNLTGFNKVSNIKFHKNLSSASPADTSQQA